MKQVILFLSILFISVSAIAQNKGVVTEKHKVLGNCNSCKKRIEAAAFIKGVKRVEWDKHSQNLTLTYDAGKTNPEAILTSVARVGHESDLVKVDANDPAYKKLPTCCAYKEHKCEDDE
ncbi:MAG: copper chaperone [Flavipsychrobacter sp.]|nr:copper chaperone [Flavipsychrobacter sp.]